MKTNIRKFKSLASLAKAITVMLSLNLSACGMGSSIPDDCDDAADFTDTCVESKPVVTMPPPVIINTIGESHGK